MPTCYEVVHDFAGPVATVVASFTAAVITWHFGRTQARIAKQQAKIAEQQANLASIRLQYDLFDRRFRVYNEAKTLLVYVQREHRISDEAYDEYVRGTVDAVFFLDEAVAAYLDEVKSKAIDLMAVKKRLRDPELPTYHDDADAEARLTTWFNGQFPVLAEKFRPFLALQESPLKLPARAA